MARNIYSPLIISTISFFFIFFMVMIIFTSTRFTDKYINDQVNKNTMVVSSINSKTKTVNNTPVKTQPVKKASTNAYANVKSTQRQT